jgi:hypothetical protein
MIYSISILLGTVYDSRQAPVAPIIPERWSAHQPPRLAASRTHDRPRPHTDIAPVTGGPRIPIFHGTHMAMTSFMLVGNAADSPAPLLRPSPATDHDAEMLGVEDPDLGYDAEKFPYKQP